MVGYSLLRFALPSPKIISLEARPKFDKTIQSCLRRRLGWVRLARSCTHGTKLKEIKIRKFKRNTVFIFKVYTVYVIANLNLKGFSFFIHTVVN
jgi:hypothetical protein